MGNSQCTEKCSLEDFTMEVLKQTKNARTNYTEQVNSNGTTTRSYPAGTDASQLYTVEFKDETLSRDDFDHAQVTLKINEDGEVVEQNYGRYFEVYDSKDGGTALGYQLGDELKISRSNVPQSDLSFSENDFEFKLTRLLPLKSNNTYLWITMIVFFAIVSFLLFHQISKLKKLHDKYPYIYATTALALVLWPLLMFASFSNRGTQDKDKIKYYDKNQYPDTTEKILLGAPAIVIIIGVILEIFSKNNYSKIKPM